MKITKKQLKRIIREERAKLIREARRRTLKEMADEEMMDPAAAPAPEPAAEPASGGKKKPIGQAVTKSIMNQGEKVWYALSTIVDQAMDQSDPNTWRELADDLRGLADDVEDSIPE